MGSDSETSGHSRHATSEAGAGSSRALRVAAGVSVWLCVISATAAAQTSNEPTPPDAAPVCSNVVMLNTTAFLEAPAVQPVIEQLNQAAEAHATTPPARAWLVLREHVTAAQFADCTLGGQPLIWVRLLGDASVGQVEEILPEHTATSRLLTAFDGGVDAVITERAIGEQLLGELQTAIPPFTSMPEVTMQIVMTNPDDVETQAGFERADVSFTLTDELSVTAVALAADATTAVQWRDNLVAMLNAATGNPSLAVAGLGELIGSADVQQTDSSASIRFYADADHTSRLVNLIVEILASEFE